MRHLIGSSIRASDSLEELFNTSVSTGPNGFILASEHCRQGQTCYNVSFFQSPDLKNWTEVGSILDPKTNTGCPTIRYLDGTYYVTFLATVEGYFATYAARSQDLNHWEFSHLPLVSPDMGEGENASDVDFVEVSGGIRMLYSIGYQDAGPGKFVSVREAFVPMSAKAMLEKLF